MQCLYCKKRLGLFASKKFPFCSELHEVSYRDEQSGAALRRVMDPLFTEPVKSPPLRVTAGQGPLPAVGESETVPLRSDSIPAQCSLLRQRLPEPVAPELAVADAQHDVPLEVELWVAGVAQFPSSMGGVLAFDVDSTEPASELPAESEPEIEIEAEADEPLASDRLHPRLGLGQPAAVTATDPPPPLGEIDPLPPSPELSTPITRLQITGDAAASPGAELDLAPRSGAGAPLEIQVSVQPPLSGGDAIAFRLDPATLDFPTGPARDVAAEGGETNAFDRLQPRLEQSKPTAFAELGAVNAVDIDPSPLSFGPAASPGRLQMNAELPVNANLAPLVSVARVAPLMLDPASRPHWGIPLAAEDELGFDSSTDAQRLPLHYPLLNIDVVCEMFEAPAELMSNRWSAAAVAQPEPLVQPEHLAQPEPLAQPENGQRHSGVVPEVDFQVSQCTLSTPAAPVCWELPFVSAPPPRMSPARLQEEARTEPFRWHQAPPALLGASSARSLGIQFSGTATAAMTLPPFPAAAPVFPAILPLGLVPSVFACAPFRPDLLRLPSRTELPFAFAAPLWISQPQLHEAARTESFRWPQASPAMPGASAARSFRIQFSGTATAAMTLPPFPPTATVFPAILPLELVPSVFARAPFRPDLLRRPSRTELPFVLVKLSGISPARLREDTRAESFRWPQVPPALPGVSYGNSFCIPSSRTELPFVLVKLSGISPARLREDTRAESFRWPQVPPALPGVSYGNSFCIPSSRTEIPFVPMKLSGISPVLRPVLRKDTRAESSRWPQLPPALPEAFSRNSFRIPFSGTARAAMNLPPFPATVPAFPAIPALELVPSVLAGTPLRADLLRPSSPRELSFVFARPSGISPARLQEDTRTEPFRWPQAPPALPGASSARSFRIPFSGTATKPMTVPAFPAAASALPAIPRQEPIPSVLAFETPVPDCALLGRALLQAPPSLEPRGIKPVGRKRLDPRKRSTKLRNSIDGIGRTLRFPVEFHRPVSWAASACSWIASSHAIVRPSAPEFRVEDSRQVEHRLHTPSLLAQPERLAPQGILARIAPIVHDSQRDPAFGVNGFQRFRAAAYIQIREPELRHSTPGDLPVPAAGLPWQGVRIVSEMRPGTTPVPLRPSLQTPNPR